MRKDYNNMNVIILRHDIYDNAGVYKIFFRCNQFHIKQLNYK